MPTQEAATIPNTTIFKGRRMGLSLHTWEDLMLLSLGVAAIGAIAVIVSTSAVVQLTREANRESAQQIAELNAETSRAAERTAKLQADNLALQTVMLPRHAGIIGLNRDPPSKEWFAGIAPFAGMKLWIQVADEKEAKNLGNQIFMAAMHFGWAPEFIDETRSNFSSAHIGDGIAVSYPTGKPWTKDEPNQPWFAWAGAAEALADALTKAGLGTAGRPVTRYGFTNDKPFALGAWPYFMPPLEGVYLQVGARPVAATVEWIRQGRPDLMGNPPAQAAPATPK